MKISEIISEDYGVLGNTNRKDMPDSMIIVNRDKILDLFGPESLRDLENSKGTMAMFDRDKHGRNWKILKTTDGSLYIERDDMFEGDSIVFEGNSNALFGVIEKITEDTIIIEGEVVPLHPEHDYSDLEPETDLSTMPHRDKILPISSEIYYLMHQSDNDIPYDADEDDMVAHDRKIEDRIKHWDAEAKKLGYEPAMDLAEYPFTEIHWYHVPTHRLFTIGEKYLMQDQRFRGTVNEEDTSDVEPKRSRKDNRLWLMITDYEDRARKTKNDIKRDHYMRMARELRDKLTVNEQETGDRRSFTVKMEFEDGGKVTRVFLAKDKQEALSKAMKWAKNEYDSEQGVEARVIAEAEYHGRKVKLGKPMAGDVKKYKVYVRNPKTGKIKKINFGDKGMEIKRDDPKRRKSFRARHGCGTPRASNRMKAAYWSCRLWSTKRVSDILKGK